MAGGTSLTGAIKLISSWTFKNAINTLASKPVQEQTATSYETKFTYGTGENQVNQHWRDSRTVTTSTSTDDLDLAGSLTNIFGETVTFATIRELVIVNLSTVAGDDLDIGGAAANAITTIQDGSGTAKLTLRAGGYLVLSAPLDGYAISGGSADTLRITHAGSSEAINFDIIIKGSE